MTLGNGSKLCRRRALLARLGYAVAVSLFVLGLVQGGTRYFYCPLMNATFSSPCCGEGARPDEASSDHEAPSIGAPDCCKAKRLGTIPFAAPSSSETDVDVPAFVAVVPAGSNTRPEWNVLVRATHPPARAGPTSAKTRRAALMIWNC